MGCIDSLSSCSHGAHGHHSSDTDRAVSITTPRVFIIVGFQACDSLELFVLETLFLICIWQPHLQRAYLGKDSAFDVIYRCIDKQL